MNILLVNGSPRAERSGTLRIAESFVGGISRVCECKVDTVALYKKNILPCTGCFSCWSRTPGECVIKDDMEDIRQSVLRSDVIIESFPLYFFGMPSVMKQFTDRMLPFTKAYGYEVSPVSAKSFHEFRYESLLKKRLVVISSCGYTETDKMYGSLISQLDLICGEGNYTHIFCPQGELLHVNELKRKLDEYFARVGVAGEMFAREGFLDNETINSLKTPLLTPKAFEMLARSHWVK